jgi:hypothetical protein
MLLANGLATHTSYPIFAIYSQLVPLIVFQCTGDLNVPSFHKKKAPNRKAARRIHSREQIKTIYFTHPPSPVISQQLLAFREVVAVAAAQWALHQPVLFPPLPPSSSAIGQLVCQPLYKLAQEKEAGRWVASWFVPVWAPGGDRKHGGLFLVAVIPIKYARAYLRPSPFENLVIRCELYR